MSNIITTQIQGDLPIQELETNTPLSEDIKNELSEKEKSVEIDKLLNKITELEKENKDLTQKLLIKKEPIKPLEIFKSLMRDAYIQTFVGAIITAGISYATSRIPELQPLQDEITYTLLGILGLQAGSKQLEKNKKLNEKQAN